MEEIFRLKAAYGANTDVLNASFKFKDQVQFQVLARFKAKVQVKTLLSS